MVIAEVEGDLRPDPDEVADVAWVDWDGLVARAAGQPGTLSPWTVAQVGLLRRLARDPAAWLDAAACGPGLDRSPARLRAPGVARITSRRPSHLPRCRP